MYNCLQLQLCKISSNFALCAHRTVLKIQLSVGICLSKPCCLNSSSKSLCDVCFHFSLQPQIMNILLFFKNNFSPIICDGNLVHDKITLFSGLVLFASLFATHLSALYCTMRQHFYFRIDGVEVRGDPISPIQHLQLTEPAADRDLDLRMLQMVQDMVCCYFKICCCFILAF